MNSKRIFGIQASSGISDTRVVGRGRRVWTEETYIPSSPEKLQLTLQLSKRRSRLLFSFLFLIIGTLLTRTFFLQVVHGAEYRERATYNSVATTVIKANRGLFYDQSLKPLVANTPNFSLRMHPSLLPADARDRTDLLRALAEIIPLSSEQWQAVLDATPTSQEMIVVEDMPYEDAYRYLSRKDAFPSFSLSITSVRDYTYDESLAPILGYIGKLSKEDVVTYPEYLRDDYVGKTGLEYVYEERLRGTYGKRLVEVDSLSRKQRLIAQEDPRIGESLILSLDFDLQQSLYQALQTAVDESRTTGAVAVALDPDTGGILAMVNYPSFSAAAFQKGISTEDYATLLEDERKPLFNRAIAGEYPSGSTIKPFIALGALEAGVINESYTVQSVGGIRIGDWFFPDWKAGGHGTTDVRKAIAESVNTFFYMIGGGDNATFTGLGVDRMRAYLQEFGFNALTGIDLHGERKGFLPTKEWKETVKGEPWYLGDTYHFAIGQGDLLVTPLQLTVGIAALANGGTLYEPRLVEAFYDEESKTRTNNATVVRKQSIGSPRNVAIVREGMRQAVTAGSARQLLALPVTSAAKTGTAQFGAAGKTHSVFTVFAPYEKPEIALTVLIEGGGDGSGPALQIAKNVLQAYFSR